MSVDWTLIFPIGIGLLLLGLFLARLWRPAYPFHAKDTLLTAAELSFFRVLTKALPSTQLVAPKVRLGDVIGCSDADWSRGHGPRISAKHLDFVIINAATSRILFAIELDDSSHDRAERQERDRFLNRAMDAAGVPLLRIPAAHSYNLTELRAAIEAIAHD